jgi:hypothetical protein
MTGMTRDHQILIGRIETTCQILTAGLSYHCAPTSWSFGGLGVKAIV